MEGDKNQIDHLMINGTWRRSLLDVRVKRGADVGSDHQMVEATVKVKLRKTGCKRPGRQQLDVENLQNPKIKNAFVLQLKKLFTDFTFFLGGGGHLPNCRTKAIE